MMLLDQTGYTLKSVVEKNATVKNVNAEQNVKNVKNVKLISAVVEITATVK
jgi:hypothetical protein